MWKKTFAAALAVMMAAGMMTGCGKAQAPAENEAGSAEVTAAPPGRKKRSGAGKRGGSNTLLYASQTHYKDFVKS